MTVSLVQLETTPLDINTNRLLRRIDELGRIGLDDSGGITRQGFSPADRHARSYLINEARAAGLITTVDAGGNILIGRQSPRPRSTGRQALLIGSHLDTVVNGGRLDGAYGVLAALEVVQVCLEAGLEPALDLVAVAFANEEGALFPQPFWGSMVLAGRLAELPENPLDHGGSPLRPLLAVAGGDLGSLPRAVWPVGSVAAYLELHVEQGPVLDRSGNPIGIVDVITGRTVLTVEVGGTAGHAGTTPMAGRSDALVAAARVVVAVEAISREHGACRVSTVGRMDVHPNSPNTIAETVRLTVDLRDTEPGRLAVAEAAVRNVLSEIARHTGTTIDVVGAIRSEPATAADAVRAAIEHSATELGLPHETLPSGAGHDALMVAGIAPIGMIFVPSIGGASHVPYENTAPDDLIAGARVLLRTSLRIADQNAKE